MNMLGLISQLIGIKTLRLTVTMSCSEETFINMYQALSLQGKRINSLTIEIEQVKLNQKVADKEKGTYIQG